MTNYQRIYLCVSMQLQLDGSVFIQSCVNTVAMPTCNVFLHMPLIRILAPWLGHSGIFKPGSVQSTQLWVEEPGSICTHRCRHRHPGSEEVKPKAPYHSKMITFYLCVSMHKFRVACALNNLYSVKNTLKKEQSHLSFSVFLTSKYFFDLILFLCKARVKQQQNKTHIYR